jgi:hypothetical protein
MRCQPFHYSAGVGVRWEDRIEHFFDPSATGDQGEALDELEAGESEGGQS